MKFINTLLLAISMAGCFNNVLPEDVEILESTINFQQVTVPAVVSDHSRYYSARIPVSTNIDLAGHGFRLTINRNRQPVLVWNARAVGLWGSERVAEGRYDAMIGAISDAPCPQIVCRAGIQQDDILNVRIDVCDTEDCVEGIERQMRVNILSL